jgi:hypothetical protein
MTALLFSMTGCGQKEEAPAAEQAVQESTEVALEEVINPEEVKTEVEELPVEAVTAEVTEPVAEQDVIDKPVPTDADSQAKEEADARKEEEEAQEPAGSDLSILDGVMTLDGMELSFPIELSNMTLGKWTLSYKDVEDPSSKTLYPGECVEATMTCADYTSDDVIVTAEFGNYTGAEAVLSDLPMTGLYVKKGTGVDGGERKLPAVKLPGGLTWGSNQKEIEGLLGEASFAGGFIDADFDLMYENGSFYLELAGSNENGVDYIVYSME